MDTALRALADLYDYDAWRDRSLLDRELFVWSFGFTGRELPEWETVELRRVPPPASGETAPIVERVWTSAAGTSRRSATAPLPPRSRSALRGPFGGRTVSDPPGLTRSLWSPGDAQADTLLEIDVLDCASRAYAHETLLGVLAQFQSPLFWRDDELAIGDIAFVGPTPAVLVFARANLVYHLRNRGQHVAPVYDAARGCDAVVIEPPARTAETVERPAAVQAKVTKPPAEPEVHIEVEAAVAPVPGASTLETSPLLGRAFTRTGELRREDGRVMYRPTQAGAGSIELSVAHASGAGARRRLRVPAA